MNKTVDLVSQWTDFEAKFPGGTIADFCRHYLASEKKTNRIVSKNLAGGVRPQKASSLLMKTMSRITSIFFHYYRAAIAQTDMPFNEAYFYMHGLFNKGEMRKTELINYLLAEYTTGMSAIERLLKDGLISERADPVDKRAKLIRLTKRGITLLKSCYVYADKPGEMIFRYMNENDIMLCIRLLAETEIRHSEMINELKNKSFDEMYKITMEGK